MSRLVALDTETTGLDPDTEDVFEVAIVDVVDNGYSVFRIKPRQAVVNRMHPKAAEVNHYHGRTTEPDWTWSDPEAALYMIAQHLDGAHIVGAVPDFDTRHLTSLYRRFGLEPPRWHYHLIDVETMAVGWLHGRYDRDLTDDYGNPAWVDIDLPWKSDDLSRWCGVEPPTEDERHTALGDARWVARWYRALTGAEVPA